MYLASTSRQNLETIVEAIRHLEGDALFEGGNGEHPNSGSASRAQRPRIAIQSTGALTAASSSSPQEAPLALTKQSTTPRLLKVEMNPFLQFNNPPRSTPLQHQRPGVIVVKQHT